MEKQASVCHGMMEPIVCAYVHACVRVCVHVSARARVCDICKCNYCREKIQREMRLGETVQ